MTRKIPDAVRYANQLLDKVIHDLGLKNDAGLCRVLAINPSVFSMVRHGRVQFGTALIICVHEETGLTITLLKSMLEYGVASSGPLGLNPFQHSTTVQTSFD